MKTRVIAAAAIVALLLAGVAAVAFATSSNAPNTPANVPNHPDNKPDGPKGQLNFTVGEVLRFQGLRGHFNNLTAEVNETAENEHGEAGHSTGNLVFNVTSASSTGYTLSLVSGNFSIAGTTYNVTGGTLTLNAAGRSGNGTGTASGGATFTFRVSGIHTNHRTGDLTAHFKLDVQVGKSEYHVLLGTNARRER